MLLLLSAIGQEGIYLDSALHHWLPVDNLRLRFKPVRMEEE